MKTEQIFLKLSACTCAVLLAACGSSGSNNPSTNSSNNAQPAANNSGKTQQNTSNNQQQNPQNNPQSNPNAAAMPTGSEIYFRGVSARFVTDRKTDKFVSFGSTSGAGGTNLDKVVIDGREITLTGNNFTERENGFQKASKDGDVTTVHNGYSYTRFGYSQIIKNDMEAENTFAYGQLTALNDVPTTGSAKYVGHALYGHKHAEEWSRNAKSQFDVNFGTNKITGQITDPKLPTVYLEGVIAANGFTGRKNDVFMEGRFFGPKAAELGGTFHKGIDDASAELAGSFGAKKQ